MRSKSRSQEHVQMSTVKSMSIQWMLFSFHINRTCLYFLPKNCIKWKGVQTVPKDGCSQDCKSVVSAVLTIKSQNNYTFVRKTNIELRPHYSRSCSVVSLLRILSGAKPMSITLNTKPMDSASSMNLNDLWLHWVSIRSHFQMHTSTSSRSRVELSRLVSARRTSP